MLGFIVLFHNYLLMDSITIQVLLMTIASVWLFYVVIQKMSDRLYNLWYPKKDWFVEYVNLGENADAKVFDIVYSDNTYILEKVEFYGIYEKVREKWREEYYDKIFPNKTH